MLLPWQLQAVKAEVMQKLESMAGDNIEYFASVKQEISGGRKRLQSGLILWSQNGYPIK